jgi:hypothetical protein
MQRLFTQAEIGLYMDIVRDYIVDEFGEDTCSPLSRWQTLFASGQQCRQVYGDFSGPLPVVLGMAGCTFISHAELDAMKRGERSDTDSRPWQLGDGKIVVWIGSVVSGLPGVAAKCLAALIEQVETLPLRTEINKIAVFCTGPQGYLMSAAFGLTITGVTDKHGWPFMERSIAAEDFSRLGRALQQVWTMTKAKDMVKNARTLWGKDWRSYSLELADLDKGRT